MKTKQFQEKLLTPQPTEQPPELTNTVTRNPKLKKAILVQDSNERLTQEQYNYITEYYSNKYKLTIENIKPHMVKQYNKLLNDYKSNYYSIYGRPLQQLHPKTRDKFIRQAHEQVTNWNIHKNYTDKFIIILNPSDYLQQSGTQQKHSSGQTKTYVSLALKQLLRHDNLKLHIRDKETGITLKLRTKKGLHTWEEINSTFNEIISQLQELIITTTNNWAPTLTDQQQIDHILNLTETYEDTPVTTHYSQQHYYNGTYINTYDNYKTQPTTLDVQIVQYYEANNLLQRKLLTEQEILQAQTASLNLLNKAKELYCIDKDTALEYFMLHEAIESKLIENEIKQERQLSYEAISYQI